MRGERHKDLLTHRAEGKKLVVAHSGQFSLSPPAELLVRATVREAFD